MGDSDDDLYEQTFRDPFERGPGDFLTLPSAARPAASMAAAAPPAASMAEDPRARVSRARERAARKVLKAQQDERIKAEIYKYMATHPAGQGISWATISNNIGRIKTPKQIRERWINHLNPELNLKKFTRLEEQTLLQIFNESGMRDDESLRDKKPRNIISWVDVARSLGTNRSDNDVKNKFNIFQNYWLNGRDPLARRYPLVVSGVVEEDDDDEEEEEEQKEEEEVFVDDHDMIGSPGFSLPRSGPESQQGFSGSSSVGSAYPSLGDFSGSPGFSSAFGRGYSQPPNYVSGFGTPVPPPTQGSVSVDPSGGKSSRKANKSHRKSSRKAHRKSSRKAHKKSYRKAHRKSSRKAKSG
jgi:hypothetical protein